MVLWPQTRDGQNGCRGPSSEPIAVDQIRDGETLNTSVDLMNPRGLRGRLGDGIYEEAGNSRV